MATRQKSIKLFEHERPLLIELYLRRRIPVDEYERRPEDKQALVDEWNQLTGRTDSTEGVMHYMRTQRKRGLWVRFDGDHEPSTPVIELSAEDGEVLVSIYTENMALLGRGSDVLEYDSEISDLIAKEFFAITGRIVPPHQLVAKLTALRKRGLLPKVSKQPEEPMGFADIDEVAE